MPALAAPVASPLYSGSGVSSLVPGVWDCAIGGRPYMIDWKHADRFVRQSFALLKPQVDDSGAVSEASLNPEEFARQAAESWHHGAGQAYLDRPDADPYRFRASKGIDPWTRNRVKLLPDTDLKLSSAATNLLLAVAGAYLYVLDGTALKRFDDMEADTPAPTTITGTPATTPTSITSDGYNVLTAHGADGIYRTTSGAATTASYITGGIALVAIVKDRVMAANANELYNITTAYPGPAAKPAALFAHRSTSFVWVGFADGPGHIYAAGYVGDKSTIYKTSIKPDGTALDVPTVAGQLPDGEIVRSIQGYLDFLLVGTDQGWRLLSLDSNGNITGSSLLIPHTSPVRAFEPQGDFIWYGLTNYDADSTGLGRASLRDDAFTSTLTPAYASDLMAAGAGNVLSIATFDGVRVFTVSGLGVYAETDELVASGTIDSGLVTYGLPDDKVSVYLDVRHLPLDGEVDVALAVDGADRVDIGGSENTGTTRCTIPTGQLTGETFEVRLTLTRDATDDTAGPEVTRWTLEANPAPGRGERLTVPLLLFETVVAGGADVPVRVGDEIAHLIALETAGTVTTFQTGAGTHAVILDDHVFLQHSYTKQRDAFNGTWLVEMRRPRQRQGES